jgi:predicted nucleic acid-binding protein
MSVYLLDTCIWQYWFNNSCKEHGDVINRIDQMNDDDRIYISVITWGEITFGHKLVSPHDETTVQSEYLQFVQSKGPATLNIDTETANNYGIIKAQLFEKKCQRIKRIKSARKNQLIKPIDSKELGFDDNDIWLASQAVTRYLILVSNDNDFSTIKNLAVPTLRIDNWIS